MANFNKYPHVFSPIQVGTMTLKNRIQFSPMICALETPTGEITQEYIDWIAQQARTGASLITVGGTSIDHETGDDFESEIDVTTDMNVVGLKRLADEAHYYHPHCHNVRYAEAFKKCPDIHIPVTTVGSITTVAEAEEILAAGKADMVAMARPLMAEPNLLKNAYAGKEENSRPCLRCFECASAVAHQLHCAVNPTCGRETQYRVLPRAEEKKKCVVIGGGPSGMLAAQVLAKRGHEVTLFEKEAELGRKLYEISNLSFKSDMRRYWKWDVETTKKCGAKVLLGTEATPELVMAEEPDAIFIAVGSSPIVPPIPGIERSAGILDVDNDRVELGKKVVVCGGGLSGTECALELAYKGHEVTVVDMLPVQAFAKDAAPAPYTMLHALLKQNKVKLIGNSKVLSISDKGVEIIDRDLRHQFLEADTVVNALGMRANKEIVDRFAGLIPEVYVIGDAAGGGNMRHATASAFIPAVEC